MRRTVANFVASTFSSPVNVTFVPMPVYLPIFQVETSESISFAGVCSGMSLSRSFQPSFARSITAYQREAVSASESPILTSRTFPTSM